MSEFRAPADHSGEMRPEWFGGNLDAFRMAIMLVRLAHVWDDLIDRDEEVPPTQINDAFASCLVYLPANPFYNRIQTAIGPMWVSVISAYEAANHFEQTKDEHGLEVGHTLRFAAGHIIAYAIHVCVGPDTAREYVPQMWKLLANERIADYKIEHMTKE